MNNPEGRNNPQRGRSERSGAIIAAVIGAIATVVAAVIGIASSGDSPPSTGAAASPSDVVNAGIDAPRSGPTISDAVPALVTSVPDAYIGTWSGSLREANAPDLNISLSIGKGSLGSAVASLQIPALVCTYVGYLESGGSPLMLVVQATANTQNLCTAQGEVRLTTLANGNLRYELLQSCDNTPSGPVCGPRTAVASLSQDN